MSRKRGTGYLISGIFYHFVWLLTLCAWVAEAVIARDWWKMHRYVEKFGAAENPRAAEDAFMLGYFAILLMPFVVVLLVVSLIWRKRRVEKLVKTEREDEVTDER